MLEACGSQLQALGEYLLQVFELLDQPLTFLVTYIEQLFERIRQFLTYSFQTSWPDIEYQDDLEPPPSPTPLPRLTQPLPDCPDRQLPVPVEQLPVPPTRVPPGKVPPSPSSVPDRPASQSSLDGVDEALDLSLRYTHSSLIKPQDTARHAQNTHNPQATDTLDWNREVSRPADLWPGVTKPKTTATHVQSARLSSQTHLRQNEQSAARRTSDSCLETLYAQQSTMKHHTSAPLCREQPTLCEAPVALWSQERTFNSYQQFSPVSYEQRSQYPVAPDSDEQGSLPVQSVAPVAPESVPRGPVSNVSGTRACLVSCVLQSLGVVSEFVSAIQLTATQCSAAVSSDQVIRLISTLSDVLSAIHCQHQPPGSHQWCLSAQSLQSDSPVNVDEFMSAVSPLLPAADKMMMMMMTDGPTGADDHHYQQQQQQQQQQDVVVVQFLISLLQLLRPLLNSHALGISHNS